MIATREDIRLGFEDDLRVVLAEEAVAGAFADGMIVAAGSTYGLAEPFADVAISTLEEYRCRGYARAAASLVCAKSSRSTAVGVAGSAGGCSSQRRADVPASGSAPHATTQRCCARVGAT